jgi:hypothetical protein
MALFGKDEVKFATNAAQSLNAWTPATDATFDMGVLVIGTTKVGCLWVEDEERPRWSPRRAWLPTTVRSC